MRQIHRGLGEMGALVAPRAIGAAGRAEAPMAPSAMPRARPPTDWDPRTGRSPSVTTGEDGSSA